MRRIKTKKRTKSLNKFLENLSAKASQVDLSSLLLKKYFTEFVKNYCHNPLTYLHNTNTFDGFLALNHRDFESVYQASGALGFTLIQYLTAIHRILSFPEFLAKHPNLRKELLSYEKFIGLGTTHLANSSSALKSTVEKGCYKIAGKIAWATGYDLFDYLLIGFKDENDCIIYSIIPFKERKSLKILENKNMFVFSSTNTVRMEFKNYLVNEDQVLWIKRKDDPASLRQSFLFPEIGLARRAIKLVESSSKAKDLTNEISYFSEKIENLSYLASINHTENIDTLLYEKDELIRDLTRLVTLIHRGKSIYSDDSANLLIRESSVFDMVLQSPDVIAKKIASLI